LPVIKHRQLACQVGAFGDSAVESSADHDNMIFSVGTTFIFGSWIYEVDDNGKLQSHLMEISTLQASPDISTTTLDQLVKEFSHLSIFVPTLTREVIIKQDPHSDMSRSEIPSKVQAGDLVHFPLGLNNSASIYRDTTGYFM
jgi:hypothetical protein